VRRYLEALETNRPRRGRKRTPDSINRRLVEIDAKMAAADPLTRLQLVQERMNLQAELEMKSTSVDLSALEQAFVDAAGPYSARKGISFAAWRTAGVDAAVLKRAGIRSSGG
jgi:hypothetical protein